MDREEKALEIVVDSIVLRLADLKNAMQAFVTRIETDPNCCWPTFIENFVVFSAQINNLMKIFRNEKTPPLHNRILFPLMLSPDIDEELIKITEGRVQSFNHDMVPDYLRTKPEPEIETKESAINQKVSNLSADQCQKQLASANKIVNNITDLIKNNREEWETESNRHNQNQTSSLTDTNALIAAITFGKNLKPMTAPIKGPVGPPMPVAQTAPSARPGGKAPATIKTNIKAATNVHPYVR